MGKCHFANLLISLGCLQVRPTAPFSYASGLKGPIYCDNRLVLGFPEKRKEVADGLAKLISDSAIEYDAIAGLATAGIPHGAMVAERLEKPFIYIRAKAKGHGKGNQVEGHYSAGDRILMVEDLVNQASSLEVAVAGGRDAGLVVAGLFSIVDYQSKVAASVLQKLKLELNSLTNFEYILKACSEQSICDESGLELLKEWQADPVSWSERHS